MRTRFLIIVIAGLTVVCGAAAMFYALRQPPEAPSAEPVTSPAATPAPVRTATPTPTARPAAPKPNEPTPTPEATPTTGTLIIESDVPDSGVFIDRVYIGAAPVTAADIKPGQHTINVSATGYDGIVETIDVAPGTRTLSIKFKEIRLNATLAVVHKHAIGSCSGTLRATPQGLTYETANKEDGFTAALTDLETFTADYLQKNLRVKIKNGKTFNFTDPEGNADRLLIFHRDVDKARQRILSGK